MKIVAMFAYCERDKHLVAGALINLSWVDEIIAYDNSGKPYNEREMRLEMKRRAIAKGADWILELDPDERFEKNASKVFREVTRTKQKVVYQVHFRELYTPDSYRIDGIWGKKHRMSLYPVYPDQKIKNKKFNMKTWPVTPDYKRVALDVNLYHLKMIEPENRIKRVEWLKTIDPNAETQARGYDYLLDDTGIELEKIPSGREYFPRYERRILA
jgi:hypothetical protein